ncbi:MAG: septum formation initiator family protein [Clostridia bacterium]|nr:septum formation initiator family protein [Clostridia bacterium]MBQ1375947.1 septum formation initiator family protein [Clostridia bacterium]MBQ1434998.1 septum formation initiator family protein [Clostridia bacterium]MBQ4248938.1 septum formation initiator family protein [Clostridia bacterium]
MEGANRTNGRRRVLLIIILIAFFVYIIYEMATLSSMIEKKTRDLETLRTQVEEQRIVNEQLERTLEQPIDAEYVERVAREKLGLAYPNERVFVNVDSN